MSNLVDFYSYPRLSSFVSILDGQHLFFYKTAPICFCLDSSILFFPRLSACISIQNFFPFFLIKNYPQLFLFKTVYCCPYPRLSNLVSVEKISSLFLTKTIHLCFCRRVYTLFLSKNIYCSYQRLSTFFMFSSVDFY